MEERRKGCSVAAEAPPPLLGLVVVAVLPPPGCCIATEDLEGMSRRRCALSLRCRRLELAAELLHRLQAVASPLISSSPSPLITMVVSSVTSSKVCIVLIVANRDREDIKSGHGFVVGDEGYRQDSDIQKVKLSREALTQLSKLVESRVSIGNLEGNQLTGAVPMQLRANSNNGMLKTSNSNKVVVPLVASLGGGFVILATTITSFFIFKRHRGASGTVYHGYVGDTEVAVKMLSPSDSNSA
ncbi:hypothetical protein Ahy_B06g083085 [Arachis hypogaea]|uniref:Uncharacterized protein n=1 Tax=Arachis hypogaea TaxID=3818 RepID=A0A444YP97_ARAHY|nr:hypothetical protein Ahy_B06g083085 [Arachis hypogaea]